MNRTPIYAEHVSLGARMMPFAGWDMPLQYSSIIDEHLTVRSRCGAFDVSHMGNVMVTGDGAQDAMVRLMTNDVATAAIGKCVYSHILDSEGRILDDTIVTRTGEDEFLVVPNAATTSKMLAWIGSHAEGAEVIDLSDALSAIAVQGPTAASVVSETTTADVSSIRPFRAAFVELDRIGLSAEASTELLKGRVSRAAGGSGAPAFLSRTGYTGEDGFEVVCENEVAVALWRALLDKGREQGLRPVGLGARDTLRLEKGLLLSGMDFDGTQTPLQTGPAWVVKPGHDFIGREAVERQRLAGGFSTLVGFRMNGREVPRHGYDIVIDSTTVGRVTSGTHSPVLKAGIGLGYVPLDHTSPGTEIQIDVRGAKAAARIVETPFVRREQR
ncbi:MAG: glycine cleavage system aminomethyltransferase GcvT [Methanobacteriota archaeon]|nr:MAG: glycine cleavage system aminomethyltransferase GcvT [Euryarchaeota archaeon]